MDITNYLKDGFPTLYLLTHEVDRAVRTVSAERWQIYSWNCRRGVTEPSGRVIDDVIDPLLALKWIFDHRDTVLLAQNYHHFLTSIEIVQEILNSTPVWKAQGSCLVVVGPKAGASARDRKILHHSEIQFTVIRRTTKNILTSRKRSAQLLRKIRDIS